MNTAFSLSSYPFEKLADKLNPLKLLALGMVLLALANLLFAYAANYRILAAGIVLFGMNLGDTDEVVGMQIHSEGDDFLIVSEKGMGKRTPLDEFTVQHRGGKGLRCYKITEKTGYVIGVKTIKPEEEIMLITTEGIVIRMKSDSISVIGRNTSGVKLINIDADSDIKVASVAKVRFQEEDESEDMEEDISEVSEETVSDENEAIENETAPEEV